MKNMMIRTFLSVALIASCLTRGAEKSAYNFCMDGQEHVLSVNGKTLSTNGWSVVADNPIEDLVVDFDSKRFAYTGSEGANIKPRSDKYVVLRSLESGGLLKSLICRVGNTEFQYNVSYCFDKDENFNVTMWNAQAPSEVRYVIDRHNEKKIENLWACVLDKSFSLAKLRTFPQLHKAVLGSTGKGNYADVISVKEYDSPESMQVGSTFVPVVSFKIPAFTFVTYTPRRVGIISSQEEGMLKELLSKLVQNEMGKTGCTNRLFWNPEKIARMILFSHTWGNETILNSLAKEYVGRNRIKRDVNNGYVEYKDAIGGLHLSMPHESLFQNYGSWALESMMPGVAWVVAPKEITVIEGDDNKVGQVITENILKQCTYENTSPLKNAVTDAAKKNSFYVHHMITPQTNGLLVSIKGGEKNDITQRWTKEGDVWKCEKN